MIIQETFSHLSIPYHILQLASLVVFLLPFSIVDLYDHYAACCVPLRYLFRIRSYTEKDNSKQQELCSGIHLPFQIMQQSDPFEMSSYIYGRSRKSLLTQ